MEKPFDIVIYHSNCYDGFASAWAARRHSPSAQFVGAQYGDEPPDVRGKRVLICDFSYPRELLVSMNDVADGMLVLDHHKTSAEDLQGLSFAIFDINRSGAGMTWDTLFPDRRRPALIDFVEDRDLWRFAFPESRRFHAALSMIPFDFEAWDEFVYHNLDDILQEGDIVLRYHQVLCTKISERACRGFLGDHPVWIANAPPELLSETADILQQREPRLPVLCWSWDGTRNDFYCSLRSRDDGPDVSKIAREFGGGGHRRAAGFRQKLCPV